MYQLEKKRTPETINEVLEMISKLRFLIIDEVTQIKFKSNEEKKGYLMALKDIHNLLRK